MPRLARSLLAASIALVLAAPACARRAEAPSPAAAQASAARSPAEWTRGTTCYEVFVRSFQDSDGDGIGDLNGLTSRLDYINDGDPRTTRDLGAGCIWLMPVAESPSYHGYDVTDYYRVERDYGTNEDFRRFIAEAHRRGIRVLVDMVINHMSSDHPVFQAALRDTASPYRRWFRWSATRGAQNEWGGYNWHKSPVRDEYYYGFFWGGMPDLNYDEPAVLAEFEKVATFWVEEMHVDGFRLDAIRHLAEEGSRTTNVPATHEILRKYAAHVRRIAPDAWTVGEVMDSTGAMLAYYPDQLDAHFAFEIADSIVSAVRTGSAKGLLPPVLRVQRALRQHEYAPFLRNHDQPRTRTELGGDMAKARIASFLLLTMPGVPFVYYGEEIGMTGNKPDERIRTPMQWTSARGAGFTTGTPWQRLQDDSAMVTVAAQDADPRSVLNLHRRIIHLRAANSALGAGELVPLATSHDAVTAYLRRDGTRVVLVLANLGATPVSGAAVSAPAGVLPATGASPRSLLGGVAAAPPRPAADGSVNGWVPVPTLAPMEGYLFDLSSGGGGA